MCGRRVCDPEAVCMGNKICHCMPPYVGHGHVKCHTKDYVSCHVIDDPYLNTFCSEKASLPLPCRYRLTSLTTDADCELTVFTTNHFFLDYLSYITGVEISVGVSGDSLEIVYDVTPGTPPKAYYKLGSSTQVYLSPGTNTVLFKYMTFVITLDDSDGSFTVDAIDCAFNVLFRPHSGAGAVIEQRKTPGVACTVRKTASFRGGYPVSLCAKPECTDNGLKVYQNENNLNTEALAALFAWLKSGTEQTPGSQCEAAMATFNSDCITQALSTQAVNTCGTMFSSPTIRCITKNFEILQMFTSCINAICTQNSQMCVVLDSAVKEAECTIPGLTAACLTL